MNTVKKMLKMTMVLGALVVFLAACGSKDSSDKGSNKEATITYSIWDDNQMPGMKAIADAFMEKNPNIKVKVESTPWGQYWTKLEAGATGKNMPDVFWMHGNEANRYMSNEALLDLSDLVKDSKELDISKYPKDIVEMYSYEGKNYGIPKDVDAIGLWYNKTLFDEAGLAYPDDTWTWDTLVENAKKLTNHDKGIYGFAAPNDAQAGFGSFIVQNGGSMLSADKKSSEINSPATVEALQWWLDFSLKDKTSPNESDFAENNYNSYFVSGRVAMATFGSWQVADFADNEYARDHTDVAVLPKGKKQATLYNGLANAVAASTKNKEAATKFVEFLGTKEAQEIQGEKGAAIPAYEGVSEGWVASTSKTFNTQAYIDMLEHKVLIPNALNYGKVDEFQQGKLAQVFAGKANLEETTKEISVQVDKILNE